MRGTGSDSAVGLRSIELGTGATREVTQGQLPPPPVGVGVASVAEPVASPVPGGVSRELSSSALGAIHEDEVVRARGWSTAVSLLCASALFFTPFLAATVGMRVLFAASLSVLLVVSEWFRRRIRDAAAYDQRAYLVFGYSQCTCAFGIQYCVGVFSPTPVVVVVGLMYLGLSMYRRQAYLVCGYAIAGWIAMAGLMATGVIRDRGLVRADGSDRFDLLFVVVMIPLVFVLTVWLARVSRVSMLTAIERSIEAQQLAQKREDQLAEAQQNLEQALRAGAGQRGRYTGVVAGERWELASLVGRGAMGEVYAAREVTGHRSSAVKILQADSLERDSLVSRFLREGELASRLNNRHIVSIYDVGKMPDGVPYFAMELLHGDDLAALLRKGQSLELPEVVRLVREICHGLSEAHAAGIVHRDLKPENLFCSREPGAAEGTWKILDFGVSKLEGTATLTEHVLVGTPGYMAPEQARAGEVTPRSDLFSLGAVVYRALTGRRPFFGRDVPQVLFSLVYKNPIRPSLSLPNLPGDVDHVMALALAKDPDMRFPDAAAFAAAFAAAAENRLDPELRARAEARVARFPWAEGRNPGD